MARCEGPEPAVTHHSKPAGHVVHYPVDWFKDTVQQGVRVSQAVEAERLQQQFAVSPQPDKRSASAGSLRAAHLAPAQGEPHGPSELPPPATAHAHNTAAPPLLDCRHTGTQTHTHQQLPTHAAQTSRSS